MQGFGRRRVDPAARNTAYSAHDRSRIRAPSLPRPAAQPGARRVPRQPSSTVPVGTEICREAMEEMQRYLVECNANHGGAFATSRESRSPPGRSPIAPPGRFAGGQRSAVRRLWRREHDLPHLRLVASVAKTWRAGDEIVVTKLDHDADVSPWVLAAQDHARTVKYVPFSVAEDCTLDLDEFRRAITSRNKARRRGLCVQCHRHHQPGPRDRHAAHEAGALTFVDAVPTPRTARSMSGAWTRTSWSARPTSGLGRTSAFCGKAEVFDRCGPTRSAPPAICRRTSSRPAHRASSRSRACAPRSGTSNGSGRLSAGSQHTGMAAGPC